MNLSDIEHVITIRTVTHFSNRDSGGGPNRLVTAIQVCYDMNGTQVCQYNPQWQIQMLHLGDFRVVLKQYKIGICKPPKNLPEFLPYLQDALSFSFQSSDSRCLPFVASSSPSWFTMVCNILLFLDFFSIVMSRKNILIIVTAHSERPSLFPDSSALPKRKSRQQCDKKTRTY